MFYLVDILLIAVLVCVIWASVKFGFTRNFVFGILRTVIALAGGAALCFGVYLLMDKFGWIDYLSDGVRKFFGEVSTNLGSVLTDKNYRFAAKIIAFLPFGILFCVLGYVITYYLIKLLVRSVFAPLLTCIKQFKWMKIIDNVLGLCFNLAIYLGVVACLFGGVHALNQNGRYKDVANKGDESSVPKEIVNNFCEPILNNLHEDFSAAVLGGLIYEYNPLNSTFEKLFNNN